MFRFTTQLFMALSFALATNSLSFAGEKILVTQLPEPVVSSIQQRFPNAEIMSAEREEDDGQLKYEVNIRHNGQQMEVEVSPDGTITEVEVED